MSEEKIEAKDSKGKRYFAKVSDLYCLEGKLYLTASYGSPPTLNEIYEIRQGQSDRYALTMDPHEEIKKTDGDVSKAYYQITEGRQLSEQDIRRQQEAEAEQQQEAEAILQDKRKETDKILKLQNKCASGEWSLADLQYVFHLVSQMPTTTQVRREHDELSLAQINSILRQNQQSGNQKVAVGVLGSIAALNKLDDISDALGGDE